MTRAMSKATPKTRRYKVEFELSELPIRSGEKWFSLSEVEQRIPQRLQFTSTHYLRMLPSTIKVRRVPGRKP